MSFLADAGATRASSGGGGAELSLEEALAFFDGYDDVDHSLHHTQTQMHQHQHLSMAAGATTNTIISSDVHMHHQPAPLQLQPNAMATTTTDMLLMLDDDVVATAPGNFAVGPADAFLYTPHTSSAPNASSCPFNVLDVDMGDAGSTGGDFALMATMLQPLHLDDATSPLAPGALTSPMQALLAAPLPLAQTPSAPVNTPPTAAVDAAPASKTAKPGRPQRSTIDTLTRASLTKPAPGRAPTTTTTTLTSRVVTTAPLATGARTAASNSSSTKRVRRQKEELLYLRTKVVELEERLQQLKRVNGETASTRGSPVPSSSDDADASPAKATTATTHNHKKRRSDDSSGTDDDDSHSTTSSSSPPAISPALLASVWENVAERQYKERLRAEQQNKKLKTMLEGQIKLATSLEKILKKRPNMEVLYPDTEPTKTVTAQRVITYNESDECVFAKQLAAVNAAYPRTDDVMAASGFFTSGETRHDFRVKDVPDDDGVIMEFMATSTVPYDVPIAGNALWRFMSDVAIKKHCYFEEIIESTDDTVSRSFGVRKVEDGKDVDLRGKHTLRKFVEVERVVLVWTSLMEPIQLADAHVHGLRFDDIGWLVAEPAPELPGATVIKAFGTLMPLPLDDADDDEQHDPRIGVLTDFVIHSHESNAALCLQLMNDLLVEEEWKAALPVAL